MIGHKKNKHRSLGGPEQGAYVPNSPIKLNN